MRYLAALLMTATVILAASPMILTIEQSTNNMSSWQEVTVTSDMVANGKVVDTATSVGGKFYRMKIVQATPTPTPTPTPPASIAVSPTQYWNSWTLWDNYEWNSDTFQVLISNSGPGPLVVTGVGLSSGTSTFSYSLTKSPLTIQAGQSASVGIRIQLSYAYGGVYDEIYIDSNATSGNSRIVIQGSTYWDPSSGPNNPGGPGGGPWMPLKAP